MRVFLGWSGQRSHRLALFLQKWLPKVIQTLEPWISTNDIEKGVMWPSGLQDSLLAAEAGVLCLTPENVAKPWLAFEAGMLSRDVERSRVCTLLLGLKKSGVRPPLSLFQATETDREDVFRMMRTLNQGVKPGPLDDGRLSDSFDAWWSDLETELTTLSDDPPSFSPRPTDEMVEEVLDHVRFLASGDPHEISFYLIGLDSAANPEFMFDEAVEAIFTAGLRLPAYATLHQENRVTMVLLSPFPLEERAIRAVVRSLGGVEPRIWTSGKMQVLGRGTEQEVRDGLRMLMQLQATR